LSFPAELLADELRCFPWLSASRTDDVIETEKAHQAKVDAASERIREARRARRLAARQAKLARERAAAASATAASASVESTTSTSSEPASAVDASNGDEKSEAVSSSSSSASLPSSPSSPSAAEVEERPEPMTDEELDQQLPGWRESPAADKVCRCFLKVIFEFSHHINARQLFFLLSWRDQNHVSVNSNPFTCCFPFTEF
jgi:hypothetical protein